MTRASATANAPAASLGDLTSFASIITDLQGSAAKDDLAAAKTRIKDFKIARDGAEVGLKPMDPTDWGLIDQAADAACTAIRAKTPDPVAVSEALSALQAALDVELAMRRNAFPLLANVAEGRKAARRWK